MAACVGASLQLVCRYEYHGGLRGGIADLIGRDQAVAKALTRVQCRTGLQVYLAFVTKAVSGQHYTLVFAHLSLLASFLDTAAQTTMSSKP